MQATTEDTAIIVIIVKIILVIIWIPVWDYLNSNVKHKGVSELHLLDMTYCPLPHSMQNDFMEEAVNCTTTTTSNSSLTTRVDMIVKPDRVSSHASHNFDAPHSISPRRRTVYMAIVATWQIFSPLTTSMHPKYHWHHLHHHGFTPLVWQMRWTRRRCIMKNSFTFHVWWEWLREVWMSPRCIFDAMRLTTIAPVHITLIITTIIIIAIIAMIVVVKVITVADDHKPQRTIVNPQHGQVDNEATVWHRNSNRRNRKV